MTQPDPNATDPTAASDQTQTAAASKRAQEQFAQRMYLASNNDFAGPTYRPDFANILASGGASPEQMSMITGFVDALDMARTARSNALSKIAGAAPAQQQDMLNAINAPVIITKAADSSATTGVNDAGVQWWTDLGNTIAHYASNSGELLYPQPSPLSGEHGGLQVQTDAAGNQIVAPDKKPVSKGGFWEGLKNGTLGVLSDIGNALGFVYRNYELAQNVQKLGIAAASDPQQIGAAAQRLGLIQQASAMQATGYGQGGALSTVEPFLWSHGEADFKDLTPVYDQFGADKTQLALQMFYNVKGYGNPGYQAALAQWANQQDADLAAGKLSYEQYVKNHDLVNSKDFEDLYNVLDRYHVSAGREVARDLLGQNATLDPTNPAFKIVSGSVDATLDWYGDPFAGVLAPAARAYKFAKYGLEAAPDAEKVAQLYGGTSKLTGNIYGSGQATRRVEGFLDMGSQIRAARAAGDEAKAQQLYAQISTQYKDLMPAYHDMMGMRVAITPEETQAAAKAGTSITDLNGGVTPAVRGKPMTTLDDWKDYLVNQMGVVRLANGLPVEGKLILPGKLGLFAEARAATSAALASRRAAKLGQSPVWDDVLEHAKELNYQLDAGKIAPSEWSEGYKNFLTQLGQQHADLMAGTGNPRLALFGHDAPDTWQAWAKTAKARADQAVRRFTTLLPQSKVISFNDAASGPDVERLARLWLPKAQAKYVRYIWDTSYQAGNLATRRAIADGINEGLAYASGMLSSDMGRIAWDRFKGDNENFPRKYGLGDTDVIVDPSGNVRHAAMTLSQLETHWVLPSFNEMRGVAAKSAIMGASVPMKQTAEMLAAKSGIFRNVYGDKDFWLGMQRILASPTATLRYGLFHSPIAHKAVGALKWGYLVSPAHTLRMMGEQYASIAGSGRLGIMRDGKWALRQNDSVTRLIAAAHHLIPRVERKAIESEADVAKAISRGRLRSLFGDKVFGDAVPTERQAEHLEDLTKAFTEPWIEDHMKRVSYIGAVPGGAEDAEAAHRAGVQYGREKWQAPDGVRREFKGYVENDLEGESGREALAQMFVHHFADPDEPSRRALAWLMWNHAADSTKFARALDEKTYDLLRELYPSGFVGTKAVAPSLDHLRDYILHDPRMATGRALMEHLNTDESGHLIDAGPKGDALREKAAANYVERLINHVAAMVTGADGKTLNPQLARDLLHGDLPSSVDLKGYGKDALPAHVIRPEYGPDKFGSLQKLDTVAQLLMDKTYKWVVDDPLKRMTNKPLFAGNYMHARSFLDPWQQKLVEEFGWSPEQAREVVHQQATGLALKDTLKYLHNPDIASQFSAVASNYWLFYQAQELFLRRWMNIIRERPEVLRRATQIWSGAVQSGILSRDQDGSYYLTMPGSGMAIEAMAHLAQILGVNRGVKIPSVRDLTMKVDYLNPSIGNPAGFNASPALAVPMDLLMAAIPGYEQFKAQVDQSMKGDLGAGRPWYSNFLPSTLNRFVEIYTGDPNNTGSVVGSAAATAMLNAYLSGQIKDDGDAVHQQETVTKIRQATVNTLLARALFAPFLPAAPSEPELYAEGDGKADAEWRARGLNTLSEEYKAMVQEWGPAAANVLWNQEHPGQAIYEIGKTQGTARGADIPITQGATDWIWQHKELMDGPYKRVAAYLIPNAPGNFDQISYNAMLEMGLRQNKSLSQYYVDVVSKNAVTSYFDNEDKYKGMVAAAGNSKSAKQDAENWWSDKKNQLYTEYPILHSYFDNTQARADDRRQIVVELQNMVQDPNVLNMGVTQDDLNGIKAMLGIKQQYENMTKELQGQRSTQATADREELLASYQGALQTVAKANPGLNDLYQGVFRWLEK